MKLKNLSLSVDRKATVLTPEIEIAGAAYITASVSRPAGNSIFRITLVVRLPDGREIRRKHSCTCTWQRRISRSKTS